MIEQTTAPVLTDGQEAMSVSFNPKQREDVAAIKQIFADCFDEIDKWVRVKYKQLNDPNNSLRATETPSNPVLTKQGNDVGRLTAIAKTSLETAQMYAVKAVTR